MGDIKLHILHKEGPGDSVGQKISIRRPSLRNLICVCAKYILCHGNANALHIHHEYTSRHDVRLTRHHATLPDQSSAVLLYTLALNTLCVLT